MVILSRHNTRIKQIRCLRHRKHREQTGLFFVEGARLVAEAVQTRADIQTLVIAPDLLVSRLARELVRDPRLRDAPRLTVTAEAFDTLTTRNVSQGIGAVVRQRWERLEQVRADEGRCWAAIDTVQNPGNLGTIMRTCVAVGGAGVILIGDTTDPYDPAAVRATLGTLFSQRLVRASFAEFAAWKQRHGSLVVGTSPAATRDYRSVVYRPPPVLFMGGERRGLSPEQQALCDVMVQIPMTGRCDSLNLGVATGIILYEIFYQQRGGMSSPPGEKISVLGRH